MEVPIIRDWKETKPYLDMLAQTVINDLCPLLKTPGGAPHTISREVCCYIDYLGALYLGTSRTKLGPDGLPNVGSRFTAYLREVMVRINPDYGRHAKLIYRIYRNGPVHNFDPQVLKKQPRTNLSMVRILRTERRYLQRVGHACSSLADS